jgi:putative PIN family toxin of toxin-antitoxin system
MRVVLDTNVLVSALIFPGGAPWKVLQEATRGAIQNTTSEFILEELHRTLTLKFRRDKSFVEDSLFLIRYLSLMLPEPARMPDVPVEESDLPVVACAVEADAKYLVTGDKGILAARAYRSLKFISVNEFLRKLQSEGL